MNRSPLFDTMAQETAQACQNRVANARVESESIHAHARSEIEKSRAETLKAVHDEIERQARRAHTIAEMNAARDAVAVRHQVAEEVLAHVGEELSRRTTSAVFSSVLEGLLSEVLDECRRERGDLNNLVVLVPEKHVSHIQSWLQARDQESLAVEGAPYLQDGAAVQDRERTFRISHTLSGRFENMENEARALCLMRLFGEAS